MINNRILFVLAFLGLAVIAVNVYACGIIDTQWGCGPLHSDCMQNTWKDFQLGLTCTCAVRSSAEVCAPSYTWEGYGCLQDVAWEYMSAGSCPKTDDSLDKSAAKIKWGFFCDYQQEGKWDASEDVLVKCSGNKQTEAYWCEGDGEPKNYVQTKCESGCGSNAVCDEVVPNSYKTGPDKCASGKTKQIDFCDNGCVFSDKECEYDCGAHVSCDGLMPNTCNSGQCSRGSTKREDCCDVACAFIDGVCLQSCGADSKCNGLRPEENCGTGGKCDNNCFCQEGCIPDGCNGVCPAACTVLDDPDCGCENDNGCCGKEFDQACSVEDDNDCCDGVCPNGFDVWTDYDCGCLDLENQCCPTGCIDDPGDLWWPDPDYDVDCEICNYFNPTVTLSTDDSCLAGTTLEYDIQISNNYNGYSCEDANFTIDCNCPDGWACTLQIGAKSWNCASQDGYAVIKADWFVNGKLFVAPPALAVPAEYPISVTVTNITEEGRYYTTAEAICAYGMICETEVLGILPENSCDGKCPLGCTYQQDHDCKCVNGDGCCGVGCSKNNDNDCPVCYDGDRGIDPLENSFCVDETKKCDGKVDKYGNLVSGGCKDKCGGIGLIEYYCNDTTHKCEEAQIDCTQYSQKWCGVENNLNSVCSYSINFLCWYPGDIFGGFETKEGALCRHLNFWGPSKSCSTCGASKSCKSWDCPYEAFEWTCVPYYTHPLTGTVWAWLASKDGVLANKETSVFASYSCDDGYDNDCDKAIDCQDRDCAKFCEPVTKIFCNNKLCTNDCWYSSDTKISFLCTGTKSTCDKTYYCVDKTNTCVPKQTKDFEYSKPFTLSNEVNYVRYFSVDIQGNIETLKSQKIMVSVKKTLEPTITLLNLGSERKPVKLYLDYTTPSTNKIKVTFDPNPIPAGEYHSAMSISILEGVPSGTFILTIKGVSDEGKPEQLIRTTTYKLTVI